MKRFWTPLLVAVLCLFCLPARAAELTVSAAISLKEAFVEIAGRFETANPGQKILFNFAGSGELAAQIDRGAPVDVFAAAAITQVQDLDRKGLLVPGSIRSFARNQLVVIVPRGNPTVTTFEGLSRVGRLTIGNPKTVPAGQYAAEALTRAGIYERLLAAQKIVFAENVRQALTYVAEANADAGIVYATDARVSQKVTIGFSVPASYSQPIVYPIAIVKATRQPELAGAFVGFVLGPEGQTVLKDKGFLIGK